MKQLKKLHDSAQKVSKAQKSTGRKTAREVISSIPTASPDNPIFRNGWRIGATRLRNSSPKKPPQKPRKGEV